MLVKLPDGMWIDAKKVVSVYQGEDETRVIIDVGGEANYVVYASECKIYSSEKRHLLDTIAGIINGAL